MDSLSTERIRWKRSFLVALFILPLAIGAVLLLSYLTQREGALLEAIGGAVFFVILGTAIYVTAVRLLARVLGLRLRQLWRPVELRWGVDYSRTLLTVHVLLFLVSFGVLALGTLFTDLYLASEQAVLQSFLMGFCVLVAYLLALPVFVMSFGYLAASFLQQTMHSATKLPGWLFWGTMLVLWTSGGALLLADALCC